jgi:hypothetical protein
MHDSISDHDFDSIIDSLTRSATWRRQMAQKWRGDPRNARAAIALDKLSQSDSREVTAATWAAVEPHLGKQMTDDVLSEAGREVGFARRCTTIEGFLSLVADKIAARLGGAL